MFLGKVNRSNYWWHKWKMTWLVPNYARSKGPAWWAWNVINWWRYTFDTFNALSPLNRAIRWWKDTAVKWLLPHLHNVRKLFLTCVNENDMKLLSHHAHYFYLRTRDENQWYFRGECSVFGKVKVTKTQWLDEKGQAVNLFLFGFVGEDQPMPEKHEEVIWTGWVLTKKQRRAALKELMKHEEMDWDYVGLRAFELAELAEDAGLWTNDKEDFYKRLKRSVLDEYFNKVVWLSDLSEEEYNKFQSIFEKMSVEEALKRVDGQLLYLNET